MTTSRKSQGHFRFVPLSWLACLLLALVTLHPAASGQYPLAPNTNETLSATVHLPVGLAAPHADIAAHDEITAVPPLPKSMQLAAAPFDRICRAPLPYDFAFVPARPEIGFWACAPPSRALGTPKPLSVLSFSSPIVT